MAFLLEQVGTGGLLARAPLSGGAAREVLAGVQYAGADWTPDGKELAVIHHVGPREDRLEYPIGKMIVDSADNPSCPRFSPRGDAIAYLSIEGDTVSLAIIDVSGKNKRILSKGWTSISGSPCWRPDGKEIWISAANTIHAEALYAIDLNGKSRLITRVPGALELDDISRDGRVLASHHTILEIVSGVAPGQEKERDLSWLDGSNPSDLSLDGKTLVLTESGEGSGAIPVVYLRKTDGSPAVRLGEGDALALSPDGKWVLATVPAGGGKRERLVLLPTGPGETRVVNDRLEFFTGGAWLPDGKRFVFSAREKGHLNRILVQSLEGGDAQPLSPEGVFLRPGTNPVTPDGKFVLGIRRGNQEASLYPLEGGEVRPVAGMEREDWAVQWTQDGRFLYVHQHRGNPNKVWLLDPVSGKKTLFLEIKPGEPVEHVPSLVMTRDGKSYVYGTERVLSELYLIEGLR
jgi:Tol biopolymer transport system component